MPKKNGRTTKQLLKRHLWAHQLDALKTIEKYLKSRENQSTKNPKSALINMPTGTGKTGVMAAASCLSENIKYGLILAPRTAIRDEIFKSLDEKFWTSSGLAQITRQLLPKLVSEGYRFSTEKLTPAVYIMTIQKFYAEILSGNSDFKKFISKVDLLMVDEGHVEPSAKWSEAIRDVKKPKIIFTATPYRNDFKSFDIDENHIFIFPFHEAAKKRIIRDVEFIELDRSKSASNFVNDIITNLQNKYGRIEDFPKTIIRCASVESIDNVTEAFKKKGIKSCRIHETYKTDSDQLKFKNVPSNLSVQATEIKGTTFVGEAVP